jgi:hypothetical protein
MSVTFHCRIIAKKMMKGEMENVTTFAVNCIFTVAIIPEKLHL